MKRMKILPPLIGIGASLLIAGPADAKPSGKDARVAAKQARVAVGASVEAVRAGDISAAIDDIAVARRLQAKAARLAQRAGAGRSSVKLAALLSNAARSVDDAFDRYAELIAQAPPELQPYLLEALTRFEELRAELVAELTGFIETLPADVREQVLAAIAAFQQDGDLEALIAALTGGELVTAVQTGLQELIAEMTTTIGAQITELGQLGELLPPGAAEQLQQMLAQVEAQLQEALEQLTAILTPPGGGSVPPIDVPGGICERLEALLGGFGIPVPPGLCEA